LPKFSSNNSGYGYISFSTVESTVMALSEMDKKIFLGRILHIQPAENRIEKPKREKEFNSNQTYKQQKTNQMKISFDDETNWNYLFMNQNAVVDAVSEKLNIPKSELMNRDNPNLAVQIATMETALLNETKEWLKLQGINTDLFKGKRKNCTRSKNVILIKNISAGVNKEELEEYFSRYGLMIRFILSPSNTIGIAEFVDRTHATNCMKKMAYYEIDGLPLYLEFAPEGLVQKVKEEAQKEEKTNTINLTENKGKVVFVTNLNFSTREKEMEKYFRNFHPEKVKIATHVKDEKEVSSGFGFVEFENEQNAQNAIKTLQGGILDGHSLKLSIAKTSGDKTENKFLRQKRKNETELNDVEYEDTSISSNKLLIKNLAFESTKEELRKLLKTYGEVKQMRLPSKLDGTHRGFAFVDFVSHEEAKNAFKSLQNTHFYGRKLVIEWAQKEKTIENLRTETEKKSKFNQPKNA